MGTVIGVTGTETGWAIDKDNLLSRGAQVKVKIELLVVCDLMKVTEETALFLADFDEFLAKRNEVRV